LNNKKPLGQFGHNSANGANNSSTQQDNTISKAQQISLPEGGGAVRGIGEKFSADLFTGTFSVSIPIYSTPGRSDFYPNLSLTYDSAGKGNGPFGLGWNLTIPSITRKTEKGLPRYDDANESDTFILTGTEDLVPLLTTPDGGRTWLTSIRSSPDGEFEIEQYRPRIEGLFAKIEKWKKKATGEIYWRTISKDNVKSFYGRTPASRIFDSTDQKRIFEWMIDKSQDDKGCPSCYTVNQNKRLHLDFQLK
jgi:hypothetical protein